MTLQRLLWVVGQEMKLVCTWEVFWDLWIQPRLRVSVNEVKSTMWSCKEKLHPGCAGNMWLQGFGGSLDSGLMCFWQIFQYWVQVGQCGQEIRLMIFWRFQIPADYLPSMKYYCFVVALDRTRTELCLGPFSPCPHFFPKPYLVMPRRYQALSMGQGHG